MKCVLLTFSATAGLAMTAVHRASTTLCQVGEGVVMESHVDSISMRQLLGLS